MEVEKGWETDVEVLNFEEKTHMVSLNDKVTTTNRGDKMEGYKCWKIR
jgi:hypothetical protein